MRKLKPQIRNILLLIVVVAILAFGLNSCIGASSTTSSLKNGAYLASKEATVVLYNDLELTEAMTELPRGSEVDVKKEYNNDGVLVTKISYNNTDFYVETANIVKDYNQVIKVATIYVKYFTNLYTDDFKIAALLPEGSALAVTGFELAQNGEVSKYYVGFSGQSGFVLPLYVTQEQSDVENRVILDQVADKYMDFNATPRPKPNYESNPYKEDAKAIYLSYYTLTKKSFDVTEDIEIFVENGPVNAIVFDVKHDEGYVSFKSDTVSEFGTRADNNALTKERLKEIIEICKEHDIYLIARIVTFRDNFFAKTYPESAITIKETGEFYTYHDSTFISAHYRDIWEYNLGIAEEAAELGFNEIQFDYVRFSENYTETKHDLHKPIESETRTQTIQRYLEYAKDRLTEKEVYLAADVYGLTSYLDHESVKIGQFFEAIASTVDVICPMAYPSHYDAYYSTSDTSVQIGFPDTAEEYEKLIKYYVQDMQIRNEKLEHPAYVRVWIEAYSDNFLTTSEKIPAQVAGLKANNVDSYLYWGNGYAYNSKAIKAAEQ